MDIEIQNDLNEPMLCSNYISTAEYSQLKDKYDTLARNYKWRVVLCLNIFLTCASFSIVLPSLWPYLNTFGVSENFLALVLATYSFGELIGAFIWGYIYNSHSMKISLYSCITTGLIGSVVYFMGAYSDSYGQWLVLFGRLLQGLWTGGQQAIEQAYISECVDKKENLAMLADFGASAVFGFIIGPVVGLAASYLSFSIGGIFANEYSFCAIFQALFTIVMIVSIYLYFEEIPKEWRKNLNQDIEDESDEDVTIQSLTASEILKENAQLFLNDPDKIDYSKLDPEEKDDLSRLKPNSKGVIITLITFLIHFNGFAVLEATTTPLSTDIKHNYTQTLDNPVSFAYVLFAVAGVLTLITFFILKKINGVISDKTLILASSLFGLFGYAIMIDYSPRIIEPVRYIIGFCFASIAFPFGRAITLSMYSKIIGNNKAGVYMGLMLAIGAIARCIGPFWAVQALVVSPSLVFGICSCLFLVNIIAIWAFNSSLCPHWSYYIEMYEIRQSQASSNLKFKDAAVNKAKIAWRNPFSLKM